MNVKENDVYSFRYKDTSEMFEPYHCFDGTLKCVKTRSGLMFIDQYWSGNDGRTFTIDEAFKKGTMEFLCNLDEVKEINKADAKYYDESDVIHLRIHAGYRDRFFIKEGIEKSAKKMISYCNRKISDAKSNIEMSYREIERYAEKITEIESGNTDVYI